MTSELIALPSAAKTAALFPAAELVPALVAAAGERASIRFLEFAVIICASEGRGST